MASENLGNSTPPPYIPWDTFTTVIGHLKDLGTPSRIDKSAMPGDMAALVRGQVQSAFKFLGLTDSAGNTATKLKTLVGDYGTDKWTTALADNLPGSYVGIIGDLDLETATQHQLDEKFQTAGVKGQMLLKSVRFYLAMLTGAGLTFSQHLNARRKSPTPRQAGALRRRPGTSSGQELNRVDPKSGKDPEEEVTPPGMRVYPLYFKGKQAGRIIIPNEFTKDFCKMLELQLKVIEASAIDLVEPQ